MFSKVTAQASQQTDREVNQRRLKQVTGHNDPPRPRPKNAALPSRLKSHWHRSPQSASDRGSARLPSRSTVKSEPKRPPRSKRPPKCRICPYGPSSSSFRQLLPAQNPHRPQSRQQRRSRNLLYSYWPLMRPRSYSSQRHDPQQRHRPPKSHPDLPRRRRHNRRTPPHRLTRKHRLSRWNPQHLFPQPQHPPRDRQTRTGGPGPSPQDTYLGTDAQADKMSRQLLPSHRTPGKPSHPTQPGRQQNHKERR